MAFNSKLYKEERHKKTEIGIIPEEWEVVKLGDVTEKTQQKDPKKDPEWKFKYIDVSSIDRESLRIVEYKIYFGRNAPSRARKVVKKGDVIFATVRPTLRRLTLVGEDFDGHLCSTAFCILRAKKGAMDNYYLFYTLQRDEFISELGKIQRGASYPAVTDKDVKNRYIPLPPLPEQKKIAHVLSTIQEAKEKTEAVIKAAKELKKSLMKYLFGPVPLNEAENVKLKETEIGLIPEEWEVVKLGNIGEFQYGYTETATFKPIGPKFLRITDISDEGNINWNTVPYCNIEDDAFKKYELHDGNILIARIGATTGKTCIVKNLPPSVFASYLIRFSSKDNVNPFFIYYFMRSNLYWQQINAIKEGKLKKGVSASLLKNLLIPLPPLHIQQKIASILSAVDEKIEKEENKKKALEKLFKSMLHNLMTGKVRVKDLEVKNERV